MMREGAQIIDFDAAKTRRKSVVVDAASSGGIVGFEKKDKGEVTSVWAKYEEKLSRGFAECLKGEKMAETAQYIARVSTERLRTAFDNFNLPEDQQLEILERLPSPKAINLTLSENSYDRSVDNDLMILDFPDLTAMLSTYNNQLAKTVMQEVLRTQLLLKDAGYSGKIEFEPTIGQIMIGFRDLLNAGYRDYLTRFTVPKASHRPGLDKAALDGLYTNDPDLFPDLAVIAAQRMRAEADDDISLQEAWTQKEFNTTNWYLGKIATTPEGIPYRLAKDHDFSEEWVLSGKEDRHGRQGGVRLFKEIPPLSHRAADVAAIKERLAICDDFKTGKGIDNFQDALAALRAAQKQKDDLIRRLAFAEIQSEDDQVVVGREREIAENLREQLVLLNEKLEIAKKKLTAQAKRNDGLESDNGHLQALLVGVKGVAERSGGVLKAKGGIDEIRSLLQG